MQQQIVKLEMQNRRLELTDLAKPSKTHGLTGMGLGLAHQEAAGCVFGRVWNRTDLFFRSKPEPLAGYPDPLLKLGGSGFACRGESAFAVCSGSGFTGRNLVVVDMSLLVAENLDSL